MRRILSLTMENEPGALSRIVGLFSQRWYNIDSMTVAATDDPALSKITITTNGDEKVIEQITKQLNKLVDVFKVVDLTEREHIERELMLIRVNATGSKREEVKRCVDIFRGLIVSVTANTYTVQVAGDTSKIEAFIAAMKDIGIVEVTRSGVVGMQRD
ncbi:acetolactate synthase small subunit [Porticoccus sp. W117]|uniref:acetolactate synthase small subunit n=1 Tax=Porticoccus sp. W117 TaxID=3054777 RepID=UPI002599126F|nr:acetolactate synthase small subunit [Porticoccus sp. W117]MDM3872007.1 acetolactate synthase small subunit [Porticoccus sp. W117]